MSRHLELSQRLPPSLPQVAAVEPTLSDAPSDPLQLQSLATYSQSRTRPRTPLPHQERDATPSRVVDIQTPDVMDALRQVQAQLKQLEELTKMNNQQLEELAAHRPLPPPSLPPPTPDGPPIEHGNEGSQAPTLPFTRTQTLERLADGRAVTGQERQVRALYEKRSSSSITGSMLSSRGLESPRMMNLSERRPSFTQERRSPFMQARPGPERSASSSQRLNLFLENNAESSEDATARVRPLPLVHRVSYKL